MAEELIKLKTTVKKIFYLLGYDISKSGIKKIKFIRPSSIFIQQYFGDKKIVGAEVGVWTGTNSLNILENMPNIEKFYAIDSWAPYDSSDRCLEELKWAEDLTRNRLSKFPGCVILKKTSSEAVNDIKAGELDFVYIDSDHCYEAIKADIENYYSLLKKGGVLAGHDIENVGHETEEGREKDDILEPRNGVARAISEFCVAHNLILRIQAPDWFCIKEE